jgi:hypothetical protein
VNDWERLSRRLRIYNWAGLLGLGVISSVLMPPDFTVGLLAGGILSIANFFALSKSVVSVFGSHGLDGSGKAGIIFKYYLRLSAMGLLIWILVSISWVNPVGLAVGLSLVVLNIVLLGILKAFNLSSREAF